MTWIFPWHAINIKLPMPVERSPTVQTWPFSKSWNVLVLILWVPFLLEPFFFLQLEFFMTSTKNDMFLCWFFVVCLCSVCSSRFKNIPITRDCTPINWTWIFTWWIGSVSYSSFWIVLFHSLVSQLLWSRCFWNFIGEFLSFYWLESALCSNLN